MLLCDHFPSLIILLLLFLLMTALDRDGDGGDYTL